MVFKGTLMFSAWIGTAENRKPLTTAVIIKLETCYDQLFVFLLVNFPLQCIWPSYDMLNTSLSLFFGSIVVLYSNDLLPLILLYYFQEKENISFSCLLCPICLWLCVRHKEQKINNENENFLLQYMDCVSFCSICD